jgi:multimeric flavodoxin WrbA
MPSIVIVYFSATGTTAALADLIESGASELVEVIKYRIEGRVIHEGLFRDERALELVDRADAVVFGSPTYMGGPAAQFKAFADATGDRWSACAWKDKVAAGFTTGSCPNGDQSYTLNYFSVLAAQHGMLWCNLDIPGGYDALGRNRLGTQVGHASVANNGQLLEEDALTAAHLGRRVAQLVMKLATE